MRKHLVFTCAFAGLVAASLPASAGCSVRGRYCDYPTWAANAFEGRAARVTDDHYVADSVYVAPPRPRAKPRRYRR